MTAAGIGSLLICQRQLERYRSNRRETSSLLTPLVADDQRDDYKPVDFSRPDRRGRQPRASSWISSNFAPTNPTLAGQTPYYMLYGVERIGALAERRRSASVDWYAKGRDFIRSTQQADGSWDGHARGRDEHGLGDPLPDQVDGQDDSEDHDQAAGGRHAARAAGSFPRT